MEPARGGRGATGCCTSRDGTACVDRSAGCFDVAGLGHCLSGRGRVDRRGAHTHPRGDRRRRDVHPRGFRRRCAEGTGRRGRRVERPRISGHEPICGRGVVDRPGRQIRTSRDGAPGLPRRTGSDAGLRASPPRRPTSCADVGNPDHAGAHDRHHRPQFLVAERLARRSRVVRARHTARQFHRRSARHEPGVGARGRADPRPQPHADGFLVLTRHHAADQRPDPSRSFQPRRGDHDHERRQHRKHLRRRSNGSGALLPTALRAPSVGTAGERVFRIGSQRPARNAGFDRVIRRQRVRLRSASRRRLRFGFRYHPGWIGDDVLFGWFASVIGRNRGNDVIRERVRLRSASRRRLRFRFRYHPRWIGDDVLFGWFASVIGRNRGNDVIRERVRLRSASRRRLRFGFRYHPGWIGDDVLFGWFASVIGRHLGIDSIGERPRRNGPHLFEPRRCRVAIADASNRCERRPRRSRPRAHPRRCSNPGTPTRRRPSMDPSVHHATSRRGIPKDKQPGSGWCRGPDDVAGSSRLMTRSSSCRPHLRASGTDETTGLPCNPLIEDQWSSGSASVAVAGVAAIDDASQCTRSCGSMSVISPGP